MLVDKERKSQSSSSSPSHEEEHKSHLILSAPPVDMIFEQLRESKESHSNSSGPPRHKEKAIDLQHVPSSSLGLVVQKEVKQRLLFT